MNQLKYPARRNRNRRASAEGLARSRVDLSPTSVTFSTPNVTLTFPRKIVLAGTPQYRTSTNKLPTAASTTDLLTVVLTYDSPGTPTSITVPVNDPAIHAHDGGVVAAGVYTFPV